MPLQKNAPLSSQLLRLGGPEKASARKMQSALIIVASQKALPVAVMMVARLSDALGYGVGLAAITCVLCHLGQILVDSLLVSKWSTLVDRDDEAVVVKA
jgi:hypothetical protein